MRSDSDPSGGGLLARRLSANLSFLFPELPFADRFAAARDAGFTAVEFLFPYAYPIDAVAGWAAAAGVEIALFNAPPGNWDGGERGLAALPGREAEFAASIHAALAYARGTGLRQLHVMAGIASAGDPQAAATFRRNLAWAAGQAARDGVRILIEPINPVDMPGYFLADMPAAMSVTDDCPGVGVQFDIYHCQRIHGTVLPWLEAMLPRIGHMQIAGVPDRHEPASPALPLPAIFTLLDAAGYAGRVGCEYRPAGETVAGLAWASEVERAMR